MLLYQTLTLKHFVFILLERYELSFWSHSKYTIPLLRCYSYSQTFSSIFVLNLCFLYKSVLVLFWFSFFLSMRVILLHFLKRLYTIVPAGLLWSYRTFLTYSFISRMVTKASAEVLGLDSRSLFLNINKLYQVVIR